VIWTLSGAARSLLITSGIGWTWARKLARAGGECHAERLWGANAIEKTRGLVRMNVV